MIMLPVYCVIIAAVLLAVLWTDILMEERELKYYDELQQMYDEISTERANKEFSLYDSEAEFKRCS